MTGHDRDGDEGDGHGDGGNWDGHGDGGDWDGHGDGGDWDGHGDGGDWDGHGDNGHGDGDRGDDAVDAQYHETADERVLAFERDGRTAVLAQNSDGYAMVTVRRGRGGDELERYYGFDVALDHAAELLGVRVTDLPVPADARDMGM